MPGSRNDRSPKNLGETAACTRRLEGADWTKKTPKPTDLPAAPGRDAAEGGDLTGCPGFFGPVTAARSCHRPAASAGIPLNLPCQRGRGPRDRPAWTTAAAARRAGSRAQDAALRRG